ncbi:MAG: thioredoxin [Chloroflexi bacterium]|nr:thioredoxin [Chloroflexota bacterium]MBL00933.1 thioredoxin [Chloroflexota bacterium]|tara:strand:+ start:2709 stop:3032 length:324 start_codon:yes stop_codon:yes gene_type:complete
MSKPIEVTEQSFKEQVLDSEIPVLVDFWAEWCGPCKMIAPVVEELATEFDGKMSFAKVDVDSNPSISTNYGIRSIPTLMIFKNGEPVDQIVGAVGKNILVERINKSL